MQNWNVADEINENTVLYANENETKLCVRFKNIYF
jgi:hypothetical protein